MVRDGRLLVRLQIGHRSELLDPPLPNGHTHRWTVFVQSVDGIPFKDRSFVEKVLFVLHVDFPNYKRTVKEPPYEVTETGYAGFTIPVAIWLAGKQYKVQYDLNLTMEKQASYTTTTTIHVGEYTPEFYSIAKRFGAEKVKRSRERDVLGIPGLDGPPSLSPPPEKIRKKERSADVSARSSPAPPIDRLKLRLDERERDLRKAESSISPPIRATAKRELTATPPLFLTTTTAGGGEGKEKKKKDNKLLGFVLDRERPSPSPSPTVVEKLKREERKKDARGSSSPSTSTAAVVERLKKEEKKRDKDAAGPSSTPTTTAEWKAKNLERKQLEKSHPSSVERKREKLKQLGLPSPPEKEVERKVEKRKEKEKDADRLPSISSLEMPKEKKEKREKDESRPSSAMGTAGEKVKKKEEREKGKEKALPSLSVDSPASSASVSKKEEKKEKERKKENLKDRDRPKDSPLSLLSVSVKGDKERERRNPPSITPPPVLHRQECAPSVGGSSRRSASPPTLVPMGNGRSSNSSSRPSDPSAYGSTPSTAAASQSTSTASALPSLLQQPSPCSSIGGRETPSEKASGRSSISPGLRNEETASSGGSSASSHSSERREQKRIPKLAPSQREREAMNAPLVSVDAATVRRKIDSLTDEEKVFEVAVLLLDLDDSSRISDSRLPTLTYDLSRLDQKDLLRLNSLLAGS